MGTAAIQIAREMGPAFDDAIRVLAIDGKLLVIGFAAGGIPTVKVNRLLLRNVSVIGVAWGEYLNKVPGSAALFSWARPIGFLGVETASAATLSVIGRPGGFAESGRWRCARQAGARALGTYSDTVPGGAGAVPLMSSMICVAACSKTRASNPPKSVTNAVSAASGAPNA